MGSSEDQRGVPRQVASQTRHERGVGPRRTWQFELSGPAARRGLSQPYVEGRDDREQSLAKSIGTALVGLRVGGGALPRLAEVLDLLLEQKEAVEQRLGGRRAARYIDVNRDHPVHALDHVVAVAKRPTGIGTGAHGDGPLGIGHLLVDALEHGRHFDGHRARDDHEVGMARRSERHHAEPLHVEARGEGRHHLDGAAGQPEGHGPYRGLAGPVEERVGQGGDDEAAGEVEDPLLQAFEQRRVLVALGALLVVLLPFLEVLELRPDRRRNLWSGRLYFHSRIPSLYAYIQPSERMPRKSAMMPTAQRPSVRSVRSQGKRNTASASKTMKISATR